MPTISRTTFTANSYFYYSGIIVFITILVSWFPLTGASVLDTAKSLVYFVLYYLLPGLALFIFFNWKENRFEHILLWSLAIGIAIQPFYLFPAYRYGYQYLTLIIPVCSLIYLVTYKKDNIKLKIKQSATHYNSFKVFLTLIGFSIFIWITVYICFADIYSYPRVDPNYINQTITTRTLQANFPPINAYVEGVILSYNYGIHLGMSFLSNFLDIDRLVVVSCIFPIFLIIILILLVYLFTNTFLELPWLISLFVVINLFWVFSFGPINNQLYGAVFVPPNIRLIGPIAAFIAFLVGVRALTQSVQKINFQAISLLLFIAVIEFSITAFRAPGGLILICAAIYSLTMSLINKKENLLFALMKIGALIIGFYLAMKVFFSTNINGTSFIDIGFTFNWLAERNKFWIAMFLKDLGFSSFFSGLATYMVMALMQATFLMPSFLYYILNHFNPLKLPIKENLLIGASIAGVSGTLLTSSGGGSHFSFIHYANLSMSLIGAAGLYSLMRKFGNLSNIKKYLSILVLIFIVFLTFISLWELCNHGLNRGHNYNRTLPLSLPIEYPVLNIDAEIEPLVKTLKPEDTVLFVPFISKRSGSALIMARYNVNMLADLNIIRMYAGWETDISKTLKDRLKLARKIENDAKDGAVDSVLLAKLATTIIKQPQIFFIIASRDVSFSDDERLEFIKRTNSYQLYKYSP